VWTVDDVARLIELFKCLFIYLFYPVAYDPEGWQKLDGSQNSTLLHLFIYLFIYHMNIQNVSSSRLYKRLQSVNRLGDG